MQKIGAKLVIIGMVCLVFFVGLMFISSLVDERQAYHDEVINDIKSSHVSSQLMATPFLLAQYGDDKYYIFPTKSDIKAQAAVHDDEYKRGIYRAISYDSKVSVQQSFEPTKTISHAVETPLSDETAPSNANHVAAAASPDTTQSPPSVSANTPTETTKQSEQTSVIASPLKLIIAVSDLRGVVPTHVVVNGTSYPATFNSDNTLSMPYLEAQLPLTQEDFFNGKTLDVRFELDVAGIGSFGVIPLGEIASLSLNSNWQNPKFSGQALPTHKSLTDNGFGATWQTHVLGVQNQRLIMQLAHGMGSFDDYAHSALMTDFIHTNDTYTQTDRSIKYALLLIMISFGTFFLFEVIKARAIHPVQYLLVASALLVFYLLLLSLAEQIAFLYAYAIASIACVGLIGWYACHMLGSALRGMGFGAVLGSLYAAFYVILSASEQNLLMGSVFSFICIAIAMIATRHVDWYSIKEQDADDDTNDDEELEDSSQSRPNSPMALAIHDDTIALETKND